jgi:hypothetical protein
MINLPRFYLTIMMRSTFIILLKMLGNLITLLLLLLQLQLFLLEWRIHYLVIIVCVEPWNLIKIIIEVILWYKVLEWIIYLALKRSVYSFDLSLFFYHSDIFIIVVVKGIAFLMSLEVWSKVSLLENFTFVIIRNPFQPQLFL